CSLVMMYPAGSTITPEPTTRQAARLAASSLFARADAHQAETCTCTTAGATVEASRSNAPLNSASAFGVWSAAAAPHTVRATAIRHFRVIIALPSAWPGRRPLRYGHILPAADRPARSA